ncbi:uncharacterized protein EV420DRAFT_1556523 [Desarmillaria tabescens]|uniref:Uncharacterized protein n=1 Tax=Armillaria tabescens TaxID=1929756 RepID=A0AA39K3V7_ARMTA|nr:uncharacterized protein EV420DRAFT_1556523 [Desarmillaria tabescens]KAK0454049.1 hypothetical protein EV420DRAFT_1556523 [Desarmillaria tabescens]
MHTKLPLLPLELQWEIFELTARVYPAEAHGLLLVARRVHSWVEPILYENVVLGGESPLMNRSAHLKFLQTVGAKPAEFLGRVVKRLCLTYHAHDESAMRLLHHCTGTISLACWSPATVSPSSLGSIASLRFLCHLSIPITYFMDLPISDSPSCNWNRRLTHLEIIVPAAQLHHLQPTMAERLLALPSLTHLGFLDFPNSLEYDFISPLLEQHKSLEVVYLLLYYFDERPEQDHPWGNDDRVVAMVRSRCKYDSIAHWESGALWKTATEVVSQRRAMITT